jgi:hypothetical protein
MELKIERWLLYLIFAFPVLPLLFIYSLYLGNCGFNQNCSQANNPPLMHTPIPTLIPATLPAPEMVMNVGDSDKCTVTAEKLLAAWVSSSFQKDTPFEFTDNDGTTCAGTFADVQPLFTEGNLWYDGALACASCHNSDIANASARMDLSSYAGILAGSQRADQNSSGSDILGGGVWEQSKLNEMLFVKKLMPLGRPDGAVPEGGPTVLAGRPKAQP